MPTLFQDLRYGARMLVKTPVVSIIAALSLALGIAGATAMFALASSFFLEPLPFGDQESLVLIEQLRQGESVEQSSGMSMPNVRDLMEATSTLEDVGAFMVPVANITGADQPERIQVVQGTPNLLEILRVSPWMGRGFERADGPEGAGRVMVLTHGFWQRRFLSDPGVLGQAIQLDGVPHTIIGVMPADFEMLPANVDGFTASDFAGRDDRADRSFLVFGRMRPGATVEQIRADLSGTFGRLESEYPEANSGYGLLVREARKWFPGPTDTKLIGMLILVALFGLVIACANVANLLLSRAEARTKEVAVRTALGAGRRRVLRQLLTESILLALIAGVIGTLFSYYVVHWLQLAMPPVLPKSFLPVLDGPTLLATVGIAMLAGVLFGLAPALQATGGNLKEALGEGSRGGTASRSRKRLRSAFVVGELAVALALLTGAAFLLKAMNVLVDADPGFNSEGLVTFETTLPEYRYAETADLAHFQDEAVRVLSGIPGVESVAVMNSLPRGQSRPSTRFHVEGTPEVDENERPIVGWQAVNPAYFETMAIPLVSGRSIAAADREGAPPVVMVNGEFARRYLAADGGLGSRIEIQGESREVIGIVANAMHSRIPTDGGIEPAVYLPIAQRPLRNPAWAVRSAVGPSALAASLRSAIGSIDRDVPIAQLRTLDDFIAESLAGPRAIGIFVLFLGGLAMVLAAIGIYGVMSHTVEQGTREIGIRMALGARERQVVGMITKRGLVMIGLGVALGIGPALLVRRGVLSTLNLFDVDISADYALFAALALVTVALLASWIPALRAAGVPPVTALTNE